MTSPFAATRPDPAGYTRQFAKSATIALWSRCKRSGFAPQFDQIVHKSQRHSDVLHCFAVPVPLIDKRDDALTQFYRMWLAHL